MRKKVTKGLGRAARAAGKGLAKNKGKAGLAAAAGAALVAGAVALSRKRRAGRRGDGAAGAVAEEPQVEPTADSAESAMHIPVAVEDEIGPRTRSGRMTESPVDGARFNDVRDDRQQGRP